MSNEQTKAWICDVCGYIHYGPEPPDECPVCGSTKDWFLPYEEPTATTTAEAPTQWRCLNCGYIHNGEAPPEKCPVCGATADRFEPYTPEAVMVGTEGEKQRIVIAGAGIAGVSAAEALRKASPQSEILLLSKEPYLPYYRLNLTRYLAGEVAAGQLALHPETWYTEQQISLEREAELRSIDLDKKEVALRDGKTHPYDKLILTVGSHPFLPPFPGANRENVTVLRTQADADRILDACQNGVRCVCIGGGLLGLETAGALVRRGVDVTLLEGHEWLLPRQLNRQAGELLESHITSLGISLRKQARTREILGDERVGGVLLEDGATIPAELVIIATGVRSNSYIGRLIGLEVNRAIIVNDRLQTSHPDVFAAGDVAEHRGVMYGTWGPSQFQGAIAGMNVAGNPSEFAGIPRSNMLKVLGYDLFSIGQILTEDASYEIFDAEIDGKYFYFVFRDNHMMGAILLGDTTLSSVVKHIVEKREDCSTILQKRPDTKDILTYLEEKRSG